MPRDMDIRTFQLSDSDAVIALWGECGLIVPQNDPRKDIARKLSVEDGLFLVGISGGAVVATIMGGYEGHRGWINYLAVTPQRRRCGLGQAMMQAVEARLHARGCPKINLQVRSSNREVLAFYRALGYAVDDVVGLGKRLEYDR